MTNTELITLLATEKAGFKLIQSEADKVLAEADDEYCLELARELYQSDVHQARMFSVLIFGRLASTKPVAYEILHHNVVHDLDWRVQEMLARAFDQYCKDIGYEECLPVIKEWLTAKEPNQRRAASEGLRIWTSRPYFKEHPEVAIALLSGHCADPSEYVRKSIGNALRDISKQHPDLVRQELKKWDVDNQLVAFTYRLAAKFIK